MLNQLFKKNTQTNQRQGKYSISQREASSSRLSQEAIVRKHRPDYLLIIIALLLAAIGLVVVYAISPGLAATKSVSNNYFIIKQSIAIGLGLVAFVIFSLFPVNALKQLRNVLVGVAFVCAIAVLAVGEEVNGASRWIQVGGLSFQVAEMFKFALIVWLCAFLVERMRNNEISDTKKTLRPLLIVMAVIAVIVGKVESDLGSTGVMIAIMGVLAYTAGLPLKRIAMIGAIIAAGTLILISTSAYRRDRVETFLNPTQDCQAAGYQACQALIAVGSGECSDLD